MEKDKELDVKKKTKIQEWLEKFLTTTSKYPSKLLLAERKKNQVAKKKFLMDREKNKKIQEFIDRQPFIRNKNFWEDLHG